MGRGDVTFSLHLFTVSDALTNSDDAQRDSNNKSRVGRRSQAARDALDAARRHERGVRRRDDGHGVQQPREDVHRKPRGM